MPFVQKWREPIIDYMAMKLEWTVEQRQAYTSELNQEIYAAINTSLG